MKIRGEYEFRRWLRRSHFRALWIRRRCVPYPGRTCLLGPWEGPSEYDHYHQRTMDMMIEVMDKPSWENQDIWKLVAVRIRLQSTIRSLIRLGELTPKGW